MPDPPDGAIPEGTMLALYFVLHHIHEQAERRRARG